MKAKFILFTFLALFIFTLSACNDDDDDTNQNTELLGKWKAIGFGNTNGDLRTLESQDCEKCYVLNFKKNGDFEGYSVFNELLGTFKINKNKFVFTHIGGSEVGEIGDPVLFTENLAKIQSYMIENGQLKLFYSDKDYILFKSIN